MNNATPDADCIDRNDDAMCGECADETDARYRAEADELCAEPALYACDEF